MKTLITALIIVVTLTLIGGQITDLHDTLESRTSIINTYTGR